MEQETVGMATALLLRCVTLSDKEKAAKKEYESLHDELEQVKGQVKDLFVSMGVRSMKAGKTVYLSKQLWTGAAEGVDNPQIAKALEKLNLDNYVTFNHQSLSAYVRELAKQNPEWIGPEGEIIADPEMIIAVLPEPLNKLLKVSEKIDVRIKN